MSKATGLPDGAKFEVFEGDGFVKIREAARLGGLHPVVLEMGQTLLKSIGNKGASFSLATSDLVKRADDIERMFKNGLRRVAKALEPNKKFKVKRHRDGARLVFWYSA